MGIWTRAKLRWCSSIRPVFIRQTSAEPLLEQGGINALQDVDLVVWLLERDKFTDQDAHVEKQVRESGKPVIIALNKFDQVHDKAKLMLPKDADAFSESGNRTLVGVEGIQSRYLMI